jgi:DNA-binding NarL/FixJ family response regulator
MAFRILIADDHKDLGSALKTKLEARDGWQVCALVGDGREAVEKASELKPDAAILDFAMPGLDGIRAAREILRAEPATPILLYTNHVSSILESEAKKAGVRRVFSKSGSVYELLDALAVLANERRQVPANNPNRTDGAASAKSARPGGQGGATD